MLSSRDTDEGAAASASSHAYLGEDFQAIHTRNLFSASSVVDEIPLLLLSGVILFPGDTLPLRIHKSTNAALYCYFTFRDNSDSKVLGTNCEHNLLGIVNEMHAVDDSEVLNYKKRFAVNDKEICPVGVLVDILSFHRESVDEIMMIAKGIQRFEILDLNVHTRMMSERVSRLTVGQLRILDDMEPHYVPHMESPELLVNRTGGGSGYQGNCESLGGFLQRGVNPFPQWVYNLNCTACLAASSYISYIASLRWQDNQTEEVHDYSEPEDIDDYNAEHSEEYQNRDREVVEEDVDEGNVPEEVLDGEDSDVTANINSSSDGDNTVIDLLDVDIATVGPLDSTQLLRLVEALSRSGHQGGSVASSSDDNNGTVFRSYRRFVSHMTRLMSRSNGRNLNNSNMIMSGKRGVKNIIDMWGSDSDLFDDESVLGSGYGRHLKALQYPVKFSYYLSSNLPLSDNEKLTLLVCNSVQQRLRLLKSHIHKSLNSIFVCTNCEQVVARRCDIFSVPGADGMVGAYVNPHGVVHQTVTVKWLASEDCFILDRQPPTSQDSWFPGFCWTICYCRRCYNHLGWLFTRETRLKRTRRCSFSVDGDKESKIEEFWGLRRAAVRIKEV